jgi:hypothetical protein
MTRGIVICAAALAASACSDDPERPPAYTPSPSALPRSCRELRERGVLAGDEFSIDGKRASCAVDGLACALADSAEISARCDAGPGEAACTGQLWRFHCFKSRADSGAP